MFGAPRSFRRFHPLVATLFAVVMLAAACGDSDGDGGDSSGTTAPTTSASTGATDTTSATDDTQAPEDTSSTETTVVTSTTAPGTETTTTQAADAGDGDDANASGGGDRPDGLVLLGDGIGPLAFGASPDAAIEFLSAALGTPMADSGWTDSFSVYGTCPGSEVRGVEWPGFLALFGDADDDYSSGGRHFMAWTVGWFGPDPFGMRTDEGVGIGASRDLVAERYPAASFFPADELFNPSVQIGSDRGTIWGYFGEDGSTLESLSAGTACGE